MSSHEILRASAPLLVVVFLLPPLCRTRTADEVNAGWEERAAQAVRCEEGWGHAAHAPRSASQHQPAAHRRFQPVRSCRSGLVSASPAISARRAPAAAACRGAGHPPRMPKCCAGSPPHVRSWHFKKKKRRSRTRTRRPREPEPRREQGLRGAGPRGWWATRSPQPDSPHQPPARAPPRAVGCLRAPRARAGVPLFFCLFFCARETAALEQARAESL